MYVATTNSVVPMIATMINRLLPCIPLALRLSLVLAFLTGCAAQPQTNWSTGCDFGDVRFDADYAAGELDACARTGEESFTLRFDPENTPINHSPWYSFRISADRAKEVLIEFQYSEHSHRYWPKLSVDGEHWYRAGSGAVGVAPESGAMTLRLWVGQQPLWVSGQEIFDNQDYETWFRKLEKSSELELSVLGQSMQGRDLFKLESGAPRERYVALIGRQHPPEVTGALAMRHFVERLLEHDELASNFRNKFGLIIVPNVNPDGVYLGNWRHNAGGIDLNRDWGPFTQRETRLLRDDFLRFRDGSSGRLALFLDFHSTQHDVLYTQLPDAQTTPRGYTKRWIDRLQEAIANLMPGYPVNVKPGHNPDKSTSKSYMFETYGIPAITFELGDETDREFIALYSRVAAEQMMHELLDWL